MRWTMPRWRRWLGHELTHIRNGDVRMLVIAVIIGGRDLVLRRIRSSACSSTADFRGSRSSDDGRSRQGRWRHIAIVIAIAMIAVCLVSLGGDPLWRCRGKREFLADAGLGGVDEKIPTP